MGNTDLLCMQCRWIGPHLAVWGNSQCFSQVAVGTWVMFPSYGGDGPSKLVFIQRHQHSCLVPRENSRFSSRLGRAIRTPFKVTQETQCPFPVSTGLLVFLTIFKRMQALSPFEALSSTCVLRCQRDMRPPVEMRRELRLSVGSPHGIQTSFHLVRWKLSLQSSHYMGNPALFQVRASQCPFHLRQQTQGPSHIPIGERSLVLRCL